MAKVNKKRLKLVEQIEAKKKPKTVSLSITRPQLRLGEDKEWPRRTVGGSTKQGKLDRVKVLDGYNTPPQATLKLLDSVEIKGNVWEPANGNSFMSNVLSGKGKIVARTDIFKWSDDTTKLIDFTETAWKPFKNKPFDIVTNPPFSKGQAFVESGMRLLPTGGRLCLLLRLQFLEGQKRQGMFHETPPSKVLVFSKRLPRMHRFDFDLEAFKQKTLTAKKKYTEPSSALCFAWFIFDKKATAKQQKAVQTRLQWI